MNLNIVKNRQISPEFITELKDNEIFVFGSNQKGVHNGGAALFAVENFGAIQGQGVGLQGKSYAIPTLDEYMQKLPLSEISREIDNLFQFAEKNADLVLLVTLIGCGIAGYTIEEIKGLFSSKEFVPFNVVLPKEFTVIKGVKGFDENMRCRDFQYNENEYFICDGEIEVCEKGFHFCENPLFVNTFYPFSSSLLAKVEGSGNFDISEFDSKLAVSQLKIKDKMTVQQVIADGLIYVEKFVDFIKNRANLFCKEFLGENEKSSVNCGGNYSANCGGYSSVNCGGDSSVNSGGNFSINCGGESSVNCGKENSTVIMAGVDSFGIAGKNSKIKGKLGCAICLVEFDSENKIIGVASALVDGKKIEEDTFYMIKNGKFVKC